MRSLLIEFHRFGKFDTGLLREGDHYLVAPASHAVRDVTMPLDYRDFLKLMKALRYQQGAEARRVALGDISGIVSTLLGSKDLADLTEGEFPLQLDLVVNGAELAALPFEAAIDSEGQAMLVGKHPVIVTRRVRGEFAETLQRWPAKARVLFVWACPKELNSSVPSEKHEAALRKALVSWTPQDGQADISGVLQVLAGASLASIREACQKAVKDKMPFTHVHLLAHGCPVGEGFETMFGLALHENLGSDEMQPATPEQIADALTPPGCATNVLTLAACDSSNDENTIMPDRSIAYELHVRGIPVVIASQFPLTIPGSTLLIEKFYYDLLEGADVRMALHAARCLLHEKQEIARHDWASVVAYVRLPEGYTEYLPSVRLEAVLSSLKAVQKRSDYLILSGAKDLARFESLIVLLRTNLLKLESFLITAKKGAREENLGLLGSAEKRLAELHFACRQQEPMLQALERSRTRYREGYDTNLSHHWTGVQFLSLEAVLSGKIGDPHRWSAALVASQVDAQTGEIWAWGSLAELYLLASMAGFGDQTGKAREAIVEMKARVARSEKKDLFPLESTARQLRRYTDWWTAANGFSAVDPILAAGAVGLLEVLLG